MARPLARLERARPSRQFRPSSRVLLPISTTSTIVFTRQISVGLAGPRTAPPRALRDTATAFRPSSSRSSPRARTLPELQPIPIRPRATRPPASPTRPTCPTSAGRATPRASPAPRAARSPSRPLGSQWTPRASPATSGARRTSRTWAGCLPWAPARWRAPPAAPRGWRPSGSPLPASSRRSTTSGTECTPRTSAGSVGQRTARTPGPRAMATGPRPSR